MDEIVYWWKANIQHPGTSSNYLTALKKARNWTHRPTTWDDILIMRKQRIEELEKRKDRAKVLARERAEASAKRWKRIFKETMNVVILIAVAGGIGYVLYYIAEGK